MKYFLAHNKIDVFHYGEIIEGQEITTGQPFLEYFTSEELLIDRLNDLGHDYTQNINSVLYDETSEEPID